MICMSEIALSQNGDAESLRHEYGPHERQVRSVALLFWFSAATNGLMVLFLPLWQWKTGPGGTEELPLLLVTMIMFLIMATLPAIAAWQLGRLTTVGQVLGVIGACFMLLRVPIGTLIGVLAL